MKIPPEAKTLIWDLDGTLLVSKPISYAVFAKLFPMHGLRMPTDDEFHANFHGTLDETLVNLAGAQQAVLGAAKLAAMETDYLENQGMASAYEDPESILFPDAVSLVKRAHAAKYRQIIVTNRKHQRRGAASPREIVANSSLANCFSDIICGDDVEYRKPDLRVLESLTLSPNEIAECLVIGDQYVDALLAKNLGVRAILVSRDDADVPHLDEVGEFCSVVHSLDKIEFTKTRL